MKFIFSLLIMLAAVAGFSQSRLQVVADTVKVVDAELVIRNNTRTIGGYLYNAGNGRTKFIELGKSVQFNVGATPQYPQGGDSAYTNVDFIGRNIKVWRNGLFQYRSSTQGIKVDSTTGKIIFYPLLAGGDKIYVEALLGVSLVAELTENTGGFYTNLSKLSTGITTNGNNFTLRWATNKKTLTDSPRVAGLGSSTLAGYGLTAPNRLGDKIQAWLTTNTTASNWNNLAISGYSSFNLLPAANGGNASTNIEAALEFKPDFIFVSLPSNDAANGTSVNQSLINYRLIDKLAADRGIPVFFETTQPRTETTVPKQQLLKDLADSIRVIWPDRFVEGFIDIVDNNSGTPAAILSQYAQNDGIHLTSDGNQYIANRLFTRWLSYFQDIEGVQNYVIEKSSDSLNWTSFDVVSNPNQVKKTFTRQNGNAAYFRVKALYTNNATSAYSNVSYLPAATVGDTSWANAKRVLVELGGDGTTISEGRAVPTPDSLGKYWNNWIGLQGLGFRNGAEKPGLVSTTNENTAISIELIGEPYGTFYGASPIRGMNFNGFTVGSGDYPWQALYDNLFVHSTSTGTTLRIKGLQQNATYRIKLWGARVDASNTAPRVLETKRGSESWSSARSFNGRYGGSDAPEYDRAITYDSIQGLDSLDINLRAPNSNSFGHVSLIDIKMLNFEPLLTSGISYPDASTTLPASSVQLTGTISIGTPVSYYSWGQVSGPSIATITNENTTTPTVSGLTNGEYVFKVAVTFTDGKQVTDDVKVTVYPDNGGLKTMRVHFSAAAAPLIPGWINAFGNITTTAVSKTDAVTGWTIGSPTQGAAYWTALNGANSQDALGSGTGNNSGVVPDIALKNYWFNNTRTYDSASPKHNVIISGLNNAKTYTIKLVGSRATVADQRYSAYWINGSPTRYLLNANGNTSNQVVLTGVATDGSGKINLGVYTAQVPASNSVYGPFSYLNALIIQEE